MDDLIEQMKGIQSRIGNKIDNLNSPKQQYQEIVAGEGIEVKNDGNKFSVSNINESALQLPSGYGVLGIDNGKLFVYQTEECS